MNSPEIEFLHSGTAQAVRFFNAILRQLLYCSLPNTAQSNDSLALGKEPERTSELKCSTAD